MVMPLTSMNSSYMLVQAALGSKFSFTQITIKRRHCFKVLKTEFLFLFTFDSVTFIPNRYMALHYSSFHSVEMVKFVYHLDFT